MLVIVVGSGQLIPIDLAMPMRAFPTQAGAAAALTGFLQQEGPALLASLATLIPDTSQVPLATALLAIGTALGRRLVPAAIRERAPVAPAGCSGSSGRGWWGRRSA